MPLVYCAGPVRHVRLVQFDTVVPRRWRSQWNLGLREGVHRLLNPNPLLTLRIFTTFAATRRTNSLS